MKISAKLSCVTLAFTAWIFTSAPEAQPQQFEASPKPRLGRSANPVKVLSSLELLTELRKGGYVIYFRHTSTDFSRDDANSRRDDDCANQRPLTDRGRTEARAIGAAFRELKIPVARVLASPRCRTMETAMLAFGKAEKSSEVRGGTVSANSDQYAPLRTTLSTPVRSGGNVIISSHGNPFLAIAGGPYLAEGEAAVIRPLGKDFEVIARVRHDAWRALQIKN